MAMFCATYCLGGSNPPSPAINTRLTKTLCICMSSVRYHVETPLLLLDSCIFTTYSHSTRRTGHKCLLSKNGTWRDNELMRKICC